MKIAKMFSMVVVCAMLAGCGNLGNPHPWQGPPTEGNGNPFNPASTSVHTNISNLNTGAK